MWVNKAFCYRLAVLTTCFAVCVAVLGAYTRLTDAGLGCPDWPGCYGQLFLSQDFKDQHAHIGDFNYKKAWTEMAHRYLAGSLGLLVFSLGACLFYLRKQPFFKLHPQTQVLAILLLMLVVFQALLGMWTVTLKLLPLVVMAHLLGGLSMISGLVWLSFILKQNRPLPETRIRLPATLSSKKLTGLKYWSTAALILLVLQLFLGGWTSANYAALVCLDFPACYAGQFLPTGLHLAEAFNLLATKNSAGITIHMAHRLGALCTALMLYSLCGYLYFYTAAVQLRDQALFLAGILSLQLLLGILNVLALLPLSIAVAHHAVAILLLLALLRLQYTLREFRPAS